MQRVRRAGGLLDFFKQIEEVPVGSQARYLSNRASPRGLSYSAVLRINRTPREIVCPESTFNSLDIPDKVVFSHSCRLRLSRPPDGPAGLISHVEPT